MFSYVCYLRWEEPDPWVDDILQHLLKIYYPLILELLQENS